MTITFKVVSSVASIPPVLVNVEADGVRRGKKAAKHIARTQFGILKPFVLDDERIRRDHQAALEMRRMVAAMQPPMPPLNGAGGWWRAPERTPFYDEK